MKLTIIDDDRFIIYINNSYINLNNKEKLYDYLKKIMILLRKKYGIDIYGYYEIDIYRLKRIANILKFEKINDTLKKTIDIKVVQHSNGILLKFEDYFLIKDYEYIYKNNYYYVNPKSIREKDLINLIEFYEIELNDSMYNND